ncbi:MULTISPECIES: DUF559 domain-containing protein [unclassified Enterococcus]|uniref:DUF559 domain-containing protein n=1 Tax=unclassified Enterococcus TaxID=2608891 RepID=UPI001557E76A|nr:MULTISPECIES: DUF559 domain-containing protein [unclassified Enterococcus]MBS7577855.1 DUF559 domain-containing protein [Enterococcus sp. MMGLQ5-2]MBS7585115.1 DUF559 domain-containing protein [Enterococcus sp. MMGLQ5-1]NPD12971.1 DUF559 domain-containing protein [Enterococcus sp. MMGLQ5-1]NPD37685.1 DUF559 domain-containing protein [Enterococcus sp. MMGLQ5-2]
MNDKQHLLLMLMKGYLRKNPYAVFSYTNAALLYGTPRWDGEGQSEIHTVQLSKKFVNRKVITHIHPHFSQMEIRGFKVVSLIDLLTEICLYDTAISAISSISHHLHNNDFTIEEILSYCEQNKWKGGIARLRHYLRFASVNDESPLETKVRLKLYEMGMVIPKQQIVIFCRNGKNYRVDFLFLFRGRKVILEADGLIKYSEDVNARSAERQRESDLLNEGYEIMRVMNSDLDNNRFFQQLDHYEIPHRRYFGRKIEKVHY